MDSQTTQAYYNDYYFAHCCGRPYERDEEWMRFFSSVAERIVTDICPNSILDAGCAMGFLVEALRRKGAEAWGVDISEYAIQKVYPEIQSFCWVGSVTEAFPRKYDLIVCIEVLEHLPAQEVEQAIANFCQHTDDILFSSTPFDYKEATHFNVQPPEYWAEQFAKQGFLRDVDFDASFITPWAARFRRNHEPWHRMVRDYERRFWLLWKENQDVRSSTVDLHKQLSTEEQSVQKLNAKVVDLESQLPTTETKLTQCLEQATLMESQIQKTQTELEQCLGQATRSHSQLQQTQAELERSHSQLQQTQVEMERSQSQLQQTQAELERSQSQLQHTQAELERSQSQLQHTIDELEQAQATIAAMHQSKFWQLRTQWMKLKKLRG